MVGRTNENDRTDEYVLELGRLNMEPREEIRVGDSASGAGVVGQLDSGLDPTSTS